LCEYKLCDIKEKLHSDLKIIIPTLDLTLTAPRIFTNIVESTYEADVLNTKLVDVGIMTAAAPTYFKALPFEWNKTLLELIKDTKKYQYDQRYLLAEEAIKRLKKCPCCKF
jgi:patatin-like phospholipase/acyl hydrolase